MLYLYQFFSRFVENGHKFKYDQSGFIDYLFDYCELEGRRGVLGREMQCPEVGQSQADLGLNLSPVIGISASHGCW